MFFIVSKIIGIFISPMIWIFLLLIFGFINKKNRKLLFILSLVIFYFFSNGFIYDEFARKWEIKDDKEGDSLKNYPKTLKVYDIGIVLGGLADYDKEIGFHNFNKHADRIIFAEQLYRKGVIKKIMVVGGNGFLLPNNYIESEAMRNHLVNNGIPEKDILIENKSRNTKENAFFSSQILKQKHPEGNFLLITSAIHMRRALFCFKKAGIYPEYYATDLVKTYRVLHLNYILIPRANTLVLWEELMHEWIGYIAYRILI